jgi:hypothetical protein
MKERKESEGGKYLKEPGIIPLFNTNTQTQPHKHTQLSHSFFFLDRPCDLQAKVGQQIMFLSSCVGCGFFFCFLFMMAVHNDL